MKFRPCIDIHQGEVKQIVGSTLADIDDNASSNKDIQQHIENFSTKKCASEFAKLYCKNKLHLIYKWHEW